jgi:hypothetical protein
MNILIQNSEFNTHVQSEEMEYYLHRKDKYYFRNNDDKLVISGINKPQLTNVENFKYGDKFMVQMTFND